MSAVASLARLEGVSTASELAGRAPAGDSSSPGSANSPESFNNPESFNRPGSPNKPGRLDSSGNLPVPAELAAVLPWTGLRRGSTVTVHDSPYLLFGLLAEATATGSWVALVGVPGLSPLAAAEAGIPPERMAVVPHPGSGAVDVVAALLDGVDLVVSSSVQAVGEQDARRLSARARHRGAVLLPFGDWPGADVDLWCGEASWSGPDEGYGRLAERTVTVRSQGRGAAVRPRSRRITLPARGGTVSAAASPAAETPGEEPAETPADIPAAEAPAAESLAAESPAAGSPTGDSAVAPATPLRRLRPVAG